MTDTHAPEHRVLYWGKRLALILQQSEAGERFAHLHLVSFPHWAVRVAIGVRRPYGRAIELVEVARDPDFYEN